MAEICIIFNILRKIKGIYLMAVRNSLFGELARCANFRAEVFSRSRLPYRSFSRMYAFCVHTCMVLLACRAPCNKPDLKPSFCFHRLVSTSSLLHLFWTCVRLGGLMRVECFCLAVQVQPPSDRAHAMLLSGSCSSLDLHDTVEHSRSRWQSFRANPLRKSATLSSNLQTMAAHYYDIPVGCNRSQQGTRAWISSVRVGGSYSARCRKSGFFVGYKFKAPAPAKCHGRG